MSGRNKGDLEQAPGALGDFSGPSSRRDPLAWALAVLGLFVAGYAVWWVSGLGNAGLSDRYTGAAAAPGGIVLAAIALRLRRTRRLDGPTRQAWTLITIGVLGYGLGALLHFAFGTFSVFGADWQAGLILEIATYPIIALALYFFPKPARTAYDVILFSLDVSIVVWSASILIWHFVVYPAAQSGHQDLLASIGAAFFPVADLALVFTIGAIVLQGVRESSRAALGMAGIALLFIFCGDMLADTAQLRGVYVQGGLSGLLYSVAWLELALAAYLQWRIPDSGRATRGLTDYARSFHLLPYLAVAVAFVAPAIRDWNEPDLLRLHIPATGLLIALVVVRLWITSRQSASLAAAERGRLAAAVDQAAEAILTTDRAGHLTYVNLAFSRMTGYPMADIVGQDPNLLAQHLDEKPLKDITAALYRGESWAGHIQLKRVDGTSIEIDMTVAPLRDASGAINGSVAVARDISRERALEAQLAQAQRMEAVGRLAGGIAHDFNNILTAISGFAELAAAGLPDDHPVAADISQVLRASDRAAALTKALLAFGRRGVMKARLINLNEVVDGLAPMLGRLIGEDVELVVRLDPDLGLTMADRAQLEQVIVNLAVNARDAMPAGGKLTIATANVDVDGEQTQSHPDAAQGPYVSLIVSDTGIGMTPDVVEHVFEPFFTTKERGKGTGLGLSMAEGIVAMNSGYVEVDSKPNVGSVFTVNLPRYYGDSVPDETIVPAVHALGGQETVLVAEDEDAVREFVQRVLTGAGYRVFTAANGARALAAAAELPELDLLFTDVVMPGMNGVQLAATLRETRPDLPVVYASGYAEGGVLRAALDDEHVPYLPKPYTADALIARIREALDRGRGSEPQATTPEATTEAGDAE
jgi:PAS domain S-box-containing protein